MSMDGAQSSDDLSLLKSELYKEFRTYRSKTQARGWVDHVNEFESYLKGEGPKPTKPEQSIYPEQVNTVAELKTALTEFLKPLNRVWNEGFNIPLWGKVKVGGSTLHQNLSAFLSNQKNFPAELCTEAKEAAHAPEPLPEPESIPQSPDSSADQKAEKSSDSEDADTEHMEGDQPPQTAPEQPTDAQRIEGLEAQLLQLRSQFDDLEKRQQASGSPQPFMAYHPLGIFAATQFKRPSPLGATFGSPRPQAEREQAEIVADQDNSAEKIVDGLGNLKLGEDGSKSRSPKPGKALSDIDE